MENAKVAITHLATHFKLSAKQSPSNKTEKSDMNRFLMHLLWVV